MLRYALHQAEGIAALCREEVSSPSCAPDEVRIAMRAWSLNYRDLAMPRGGYPGNDKVLHAPPLIPLSDGAGEIVAVGNAVKDVAVGDRVASCFFSDWVAGPIRAEYLGSALGGASDGVLAEEVCLPAHGVLRIPDRLSFEEAACLPCAAVTAWEALCCAGTAEGDTVLSLGTGGVSVFALQLATALGAKVFISSSSDEKLERCRALGAAEGINYRSHPEWHQEVLRLSGGAGVDHVIELGGAGTLERSLQSVKVGGHLSLIGVLTGEPERQPSPMPILFKRLCVQGIYVGSRARFEDLLEFMERHDLRPVIDPKRFSFDQVPEAYRYLKSGAHFGKVVISR